MPCRLVNINLPESQYALLRNQGALRKDCLAPKAPIFPCLAQGCCVKILINFGLIWENSISGESSPYTCQFHCSYNLEVLMPVFRMGTDDGLWSCICAGSLWACRTIVCGAFGLAQFRVGGAITSEMPVSTFHHRREIFISGKKFTQFRRPQMKGNTVRESEVGQMLIKLPQRILEVCSG